MDNYGFHDGNICNMLESRHRPDVNHSLQMHSSLIRRLSQERELEGHQGCVNSIAWNSKGSLLISGSDDTRMNIWNYAGRKLLHSIDTGHSANIFCTKFVPETSDELVVAGAGDAEVRLFNLSRLSGRSPDDNSISPSALYQCHTRRVKKLAVEVGNPNVVWSASEDGTLRQHDFREGSSCPPAGSSHECRNILLDLRSGAKRSLADPPKQTLALRSCDISTSRPHLLLVGGSDAFARLYDRRMLPPLTSCRKRMSPPRCVNYFCPMHLSERGRSSLHLTHVTFSPNGDEVLLSYSGEHVYLMNANHSGGTAVRYTIGDTSKLMTFAPTLNGLELQPLPSCVLKRQNYSKTSGSSILEKCRKLVQIAEKFLEEGTCYFYGIEACNEVLDGHGRVIGPTLRHECLCIRAALLLKRKWKNDVHMAIRDCYNARRIDSSSFRALYYMSEALSRLGKHKEALEFSIAAQCSAPGNTEVAVLMEDIRKNLATAEAGKSSKDNDGATRSETRNGRALSLSDILYHSEANSDASHDGPGSDREDSDYDEELELDFETSVSGDEGRDVEPNILHGSLNLRIHRRGDSARDSSCTNGSCGSPSSSQNDRTPYQLETVIDMKQRYVGHCNVGTDIKQASFLGQRGDYVASGSDDGRWFIWEKHTGRLIKMLLGDEAVVNCIQCHPFDCVVATSGIDNTIKIWTPSASVPSIVAGGAAGPETSNVLEAMESNQRRLCHNREAILPFELLERFRMHEFTEGTLHPFECAQS
ncbi:PREDICTED: WD and tetratricopeptide repeats protein 1 isoform X2 [Populus euphratica]|uniref:WD and tetratricopeptide repeats protein 1 isoform X2 n=1 Tax=Populus euphratica TaxID=75702 RepID=A0AAJ6TK48_POPEU|nr:PREDICTED: WD and tetratricopeptide repeats protein 1 isoform X2 [Populus euphratica]XP_011012680.1 PREDICTED: WD and tetratricopeptide repeats protein 1 isoform X2 [Populus euphratica]